MTAPYAPTVTVPSTPDGQLSNKHGANPTTDAIGTPVVYRNPRGAGDLAGTIRATVDRVVANGQPVQPQRLWDSSWTGTPVETPIPALNTSGSAFTSATYGGRVYISQSTTGGVMMSAPITGATTGKWRLEQSPYWTLATTFTYIASIAIVPSPQPWIYAVGDDKSMYYAPINSDGTIGTWTRSPSSPTAAGQLVGGYGLNSAGQLQGFLISVGAMPAYASVHTASAVVQINGLNVNYGANDGSLNAWATQNALPAARSAMAVYYDPVNAFILVVGGDDGTTGQTTVWLASVGTLGTIGSWVAQTVLPAARSGAAVVVAPPDTGTTATIYVIGGSTTNAESGGTATIYSNSVANTGAVGATWTSQTPALPTILTAPVAWVTGRAGSGNRGWLAVTGGRTNGADSLTTYANSQAQGGALGASWLSGTNKPLGAVLGTGGSVGAGAADGSQTISFNYNAFGAAATGTIVDGDQLQYAVQFTDALEGDASAISYFIIKIGQPPSITNGAPSGTITTSQPTATLQFNPGAGGGLEAWYRVVLMDAGETTVYYDSGQLTDGRNSVFLNLYPLLQAATTYHVLFSAAGADVPLPGSSNQTTATAIFTTSLLGVSNPGVASGAVDQVNALVTLTWTNPNGSAATFNRIYRRVGGGAWTILKDNIVAVTTGTPQSVSLMDDIPFGVATDYAVTAFASTTVESVMVTLATGLMINPDYHWDLGGFDAMLHAVGAGPANHAPLFLVQPPKITRNVDVTATLAFGNTAPTHRYGPGQYREIELVVSTRPPIVGSSLEAVMDAAQAPAVAGAPLCYRDRMGTVIYCELAPSSQIIEDLYLETTLTLQETAFVYTP